MPFRSKRFANSPQLWNDSDLAETLDVVVPFTTLALTQAAVRAATRLAGELGSRIRLLGIEQVPYPLTVESPAVSAAVLRKELVPIAARYGAHVQICYARNAFEGIAHLLSRKSIIVLASRRPLFRFVRRTPQERLAQSLRSHGYSVVIEYVSETKE